MKKILCLVASLTIISGVCAGVLAYVDKVTKKPIADMKVKQEQAAILDVMPAGVVKTEPLKKGKVEGAFVGKDKTGKVLGYAAKGLDKKGYGGDIVLMVGFEADKKTIVRYKVLAASETPGLGSKLSTPEFAGQFSGKKAQGLDVKKRGGVIEAITSATITSRAVCRAVGNAAEKLK